MFWTLDDDTESTFDDLIGGLIFVIVYEAAVNMVIYLLLGFWVKGQLHLHFHIWFSQPSAAYHLVQRVFQTVSDAAGNIGLT